MASLKNPHAKRIAEGMKKAKSFCKNFSITSKPKDIVDFLETRTSDGKSYARPRYTTPRRDR